MPVHARVEEGPSTPTALTELVGELGQHGLDLLAMSLEALRVEPDVGHDAFGLDVGGSVLSVLEEAIEEDLLDALGVEHERVAHDRSFHSVSRDLRVENGTILS